ncbi:cell wall hydrolase [Halalkalibacterium halodurans]|uniref:cell wall hydrolase n=1 Tax=Halalkalibacterium halodurans TaxID=86665 RepID=UPI002AA9D7DB|nr:cell wall hydrolase [Halalkalibacterium halodurans]MDY7223432.1 cell wall hydrolase [Halalkalibacterium halodurans]MDY7242653.1 cell wall hydrolase [Halalkalibacterium halodurans]
MMKFVLLFSCIILSFTLFTNKAEASHSKHQVQSGDTLYLLSEQYGVPMEAIKRINERSSNTVYRGEQLTIPARVTASERDLLARLVHAEAEGEPYAGKVAVAVVVLNRVDHPSFPDNVTDVINEVNSGYYAFSPVQNGRIQRPANDEAKRAVDEALQFRGQGNGSLYFYNPKTATSPYVSTRQQTIVIGNHIFAK